MKRTLMYAVVCITMLGCNSIKTNLIPKEKTPHIELGQLVDTRGILQRDLEIKTTPTLKEPLRISLIEKPFTTSLLKKYNQNIFTSIIEGDTQFYYEIELIDDIGYMKVINNDSDIINFIHDNGSAGVITKLQVVLKEGMILEQSSAYLLKQSKEGVFFIIASGNEVTNNPISFNSLQIIDYGISTFCYGLNSRKELQVMDLVEEGKSCRRPFKKDTKYFKKEKSLFDY